MFISNGRVSVTVQRTGVNYVITMEENAEHNKRKELEKSSVKTGLGRDGIYFRKCHKYICSHPDLFSVPLFLSVMRNMEEISSFFLKLGSTLRCSLSF